MVGRYKINNQAPCFLWKLVTFPEAALLPMQGEKYILTMNENRDFCVSIQSSVQILCCIHRTQQGDSGTNFKGCFLEKY